MSIEYCSNFRRAFTKDNKEVAFCASPKGKSSDQNCGGYSDKCPPKLQKYFISEKGIELSLISFNLPKLQILPDLP